MSGRIVVAGNWKMNHDPAAARDFFQRFAPGDLAPGIELLVFPPALSFGAAHAGAHGVGRPVALGVQNVHWEESGAFTGELSAEMAAAAGATHVLIGHSERRHVFGETDAEVARKVSAVLRAGLVPVVCVGETLDERRDDRVAEVILRQLDAVLPVLTEGDGGVPDFLVAYEPVWAIGTGETATPDDAAQAHGVLRARLAEVLGADRAGGVPILYGGSVKPGNAGDLIAAGDVDGVLVGGASLDPESFAAIAEAAS
jgi:triosephosphate isomerase